MSHQLGDVPCCEAYLDDVICYIDTWEKHLETLDIGFGSMQSANLTLNLAKCEFGCATVIYLGKQVGQGVVRPVDAKVQAINAFPTTKRELRRFLGMAGYYNFSDVARPLTNLLPGAVSFKWETKSEFAFDALKSLCSSPVLAAPDFMIPFKLEVDASGTGAGAVLLQEDTHGINRPVCFYFNHHQLKYSTIEKEALALVLALQQFEVYLGSNALPIVVYTDHNPLVFLLRMCNTNQRLMRWALICQGYNLQIIHKKGTENVIADTLCRCRHV